MLRKLLVLLCLAGPMWGFAAEKSPKEDMSLLPTFQDGTMPTFERWVMRQLDFPEPQFAPGDIIKIEVSLRVNKRGKLTDISLGAVSSEPVARQVLDLLDHAVWTPGVTSRISDLNQQQMILEMILGRGPDQKLVAEDYKMYVWSEEDVKFQGEDKQAFERWVVQRVGCTGPDGEPFDAEVYAMFCIERDGSVSQLDLSTSADWLTSKIREAFAAAPHWTPATVEGETVRIITAATFKFSAPGDPTRIYDLVDTMPMFETGDVTNFQRWAQRLICYPTKALEEGIKGRVLVRFVVELDGRISNIEIAQSPSKLLSDEVLSVLARAPRWTPGEQGGVPVRVKYTVPFDFRFD